MGSAFSLRWQDATRSTNHQGIDHMILFFALLCLALAIAGATAFVIFWPLTLVHVRDRHPDIAAKLGFGAFLKPSALSWLLRGGYYESPDPSLSGLATPARVSLIVILAGLAMAGILWLWALAWP